VPGAEDLLLEVDGRWGDEPPRKIPLRIIGSVALLLGTDYRRGTKDSDVLQTRELSAEVSQRLVTLAGEGTALHVRHGLYVDVVNNGVPFLPHVPAFTPHEALNARLQRFEVHLLDVVDVVVSKLKPFRPSDKADILAMIERDRVPHDLLVERFKSAVDVFWCDARAEELPKYVKHLHQVERDMLLVGESEIELPEWAG
jgi:hypothetical protein